MRKWSPCGEKSIVCVYYSLNKERNHFFTQVVKHQLYGYPSDLTKPPYGVRGVFEVTYPLSLPLSHTPCPMVHGAEAGAFSFSATGAGLFQPPCTLSHSFSAFEVHRIPLTAFASPSCVPISSPSCSPFNIHFRLSDLPGGLTFFQTTLPPYSLVPSTFLLTARLIQSCPSYVSLAVVFF